LKLYGRAAAKKLGSVGSESSVNGDGAKKMSCMFTDDLVVVLTPNMP